MQQGTRIARQVVAGDLTQRPASPSLGLRTSFREVGLALQFEIYPRPDRDPLDSLQDRAPRR